jgi:hypothetical protein
VQHVPGAGYHRERAARYARRERRERRGRRPLVPVAGRERDGDVDVGEPPGERAQVPVGHHRERGAHVRARPGRGPVRRDALGRQRRAGAPQQRVDHARPPGDERRRARERARGGDAVDERRERGVVRPRRRHERGPEPDHEPERAGPPQRHGEQHRHARRVAHGERRRDALGAEHGGQVVGHRLEREPPVGRRLGAPVPRQVDGHHGAPLGEPRRDPAPRRGRRAGAVDEQRHRRRPAPPGTPHVSTHHRRPSAATSRARPGTR